MAGASAIIISVKFSTSVFTIRPPSPVPVIFAKLIPFSSASALAKGEAMILPFSDLMILTFLAAVLFFEEGCVFSLLGVADGVAAFSVVGAASVAGVDPPI